MTKHSISNLGMALKCLRLMNDLDVRELGDRIGVSAATISRLENGRGMSAETWLKLSNWFAAEWIKQ